MAGQARRDSLIILIFCFAFVCSGVKNLEIMYHLDILAKKNIVLLSSSENNPFFKEIKEIVERRHREPIKFLFLPKLGQAGNERKIDYDLLLRAVFSCLHRQKLNFAL